MSLTTAIAGTLPPPALEAVVARAAPFFAAAPLFAAQFEAVGHNGTDGGARSAHLGAMGVDVDAARDGADDGGGGEESDEEHEEEGGDEDAEEGDSNRTNQSAFAREIKGVRRKFQCALLS